MTVSRAADDRCSSDALMTAERHEHKYLVPRASVEALIRALTRELRPHRFSGESANRLPDAHHYVTTIYFDTASRYHYRMAAADGEANLKVRAKEYYDVHPSLAELATHPSHMVRAQPWLWFEMKRRAGDKTLKLRVRIPKRRVPALIGSGRVADATTLAAELRLPDAERDALESLAAYCHGLDEPLTELCLVNYRRLAWQSDDSNLRVTLDLAVSYYAAPLHVWDADALLVRSSLGSPRGSLPDALIEVKWRRAPPKWLLEALDHAGGRVLPFSKFLAASEAVFGPAEVKSGPALRHQASANVDAR